VGTFWAFFLFWGKKFWAGESKSLIFKTWSGRWESNPQRPAWEAGILPLNYARSDDGRVANEMYGISSGLSTRSVV
jgi:hypothetical protein